MTHTKGEWKVIPAKNMTYRIEGFTSGLATEDAANAKLMAAAPEMLAALQKAKLDLCNLLVRLGEGSETNSVVKQLVQVIKKATE